MSQIYSIELSPKELKDLQEFLEIALDSFTTPPNEIEVINKKFKEILETEPLERD